MKCNLRFFVAMSAKSSALSIPKAASTLSSLITFSLLKHYTEQQKKPLSISWLPAPWYLWEMVAVPYGSCLPDPGVGDAVGPLFRLLRRSIS